MEQRSPEWYAAKRGKVGTSSLNLVMAKGRAGAEATTRRNYRLQLACEILTGKTKESYQSGAMLAGAELEPLAKSHYEGRYGVMVEETFFQDHPSIPGFGSSGDGLVGTDGGVEVKCTEVAAHIEVLQTGKIKREYHLQMQGEMMCYQLQWVDFVSFNQDVPDAIQLEVIRVHPDLEMQKEITRELLTFLGEVKNTVSSMEKLIEDRSNEK
tara:strand:+ start:9626 stop:10258 length:633 start_codon:yes stop_codon:yes gene_type:complete